MYECEKSDENFKKATDTYKEIIIHGEPSIDDFWNYAYLYDICAKKDTQIAVEFYKKAIARNPIGQEKNMSCAYAQFIRLLMRYNREEDALNYLEEWHKKDRNNIYSYIQLANFHCIIGNVDVAQMYLDGAKKIDLEHAEIYLIEGDIHYHDKTYVDAITAWDKSFELDSQFANALYSKAHLYEELNDNENARLAWKDAIVWHKRQGFDLGPELEYPMNKLESLTT